MKQHRRRTGRMINTFTLNNKTYSIRLSDHAASRLKERNIDLFQAVGTILSLGEQRITEYSGSNRDIFILDRDNNFSVVCNITINTVTIVTVIDKVDCFIKSGSIAINL
jgi:hypothetical protein